MTYASEVLADSPLVYWRLGESSGTVMEDATANNRDGTYENTPTLGAASLLASDAANTSVDFDGSNDRGIIADAAWMDVSALTVEALFNADPVGGGVTRDIVARSSGTGANMWVLQVNNTGDLVGAVWNATDSSAITSVAVSAGTTYHVAMTYDGFNLLLYVDGVQVDSGAANSLKTGTSAISVGAFSGGSVLLPFDGRIDEVAIYGTALSSTRIAAHYDATRTASLLSLSGTLPALTESITLRTYTETLTDNEAGAILIRGSSIEPVNAPDVEPVPAGVSRAEMRDKAVAYTQPTMVNGRPT